MRFTTAAIIVAVVAMVISITTVAHCNTPGVHNVTLTWNVNPNCLPNGCGYNIYRATGTTDPCLSQPIPFASSSTNSYVDSPVTAGTYTYRITEVLLIGGESACSVGVQPTVSNTMGQTPTNVQATPH